MRLAISNIAWASSEDTVIAELLKQYGINAIDIAPGKYFPQPANATVQNIDKIKQWWNAHDIEITGMQSLLFGTQGLNVFGNQQSQQAMLLHLQDIFRIAQRLNATRLVFGSPRNRDCSGLTSDQAIEISVKFFGKLAKIAERYQVIVCLEPNPVRYGANFMTTTAETAYIVEQVQHTAIKMQLDTGAMAINNEDIQQILSHYSSLIGHIHISEIDLQPIGTGQINHNVIGQEIEKWLPSHLATIEMVGKDDQSNRATIAQALKYTIPIYGSQTEGG